MVVELNHQSVQDAVCARRRFDTAVSRDPKLTSLASCLWRAQGRKSKGGKQAGWWLEYDHRTQLASSALEEGATLSGTILQRITIHCTCKAFEPAQYPAACEAYLGSSKSCQPHKGSKRNDV